MPAVIWIIIGGIVLAVGLGSRRGAGARGTGRREAPYRVDHPHYVTDDESECSVCGTRFTGERAVCPRCGARFTEVREDESEYDEELEEELDWDEEDGL